MGTTIDSATREFLDRRRADHEAERNRLAEEAADRAAANRAAFDQRVAGIEAAKEEQRNAREQADDAALVDRLRAAYLASDPTATEADFARDLPELRRRHRLDAATGDPLAALKAEARASGRYAL